MYLHTKFIFYFFRKRVRLGEHRLSTDPDCDDGVPRTCNDTPQDFDIEKIIFHQNYGVPHVYRNDIALLRLNTTATFSGLLHIFFYTILFTISTKSFREVEKNPS